MANFGSFDFESPTANGSARPTGITYDTANWFVSTSNPRRGTQCLENSQVDSGAGHGAFIDAPSTTGTGTATQITAHIRRAVSTQVAYVHLRANVKTLTGLNSWVVTMSSSGVGLSRYTSGTYGNPASFVGAGQIPVGAYIQVTYKATGSTHQVEIRRASDQQYLTSAGAWQVAQAYCINTTDANLAGADGQFAGVTFYHPAASSILSVDRLIYAQYADDLSDTDPAATTVLINADNAAWRMFGFARSGAGTASKAKSNNCGNYARINISGTTTARANFDTSVLVGLGTADYPTVSIRVDGGTWTRQLLSTSSAYVELTGLTTGSHELEVMYSAGAGTTSGNPYTAATGGVSVLLVSLEIDIAGAVSAPSLKRGLTLIYGDSITNNQNETFRADKNWPYLLRTSLSTEVITVGFPGQGYASNATGAGSNTTFADTYAKFDSATSRLVLGELTPRPSRMIIAHGQNGSPSAAQVTAQITALRVIYSGPIYVQIGSVHRTNATAIQAGVTAYLAANPTDTAVYSMDLGTLTLTTTDTVHLTEADCPTVAAAMTSAIQAIETPSSGGASSTIIGSAGGAVI